MTRTASGTTCWTTSFGIHEAPEQLPEHRIGAAEQEAEEEEHR